MRQIGQYVVSLTCAALISGLLPSLLNEGGMKTMVRLVCGVFLTITALSPLTDFSFPELDMVTDWYQAEGEAAAAQGEALARQEKSAIIKEGLEAYILDKAAAMGQQITVQISLDPEGLPLFAEVEGTVSSHAGQMLSKIMETELGIPKEKQQWTGQKREP